MKISLRLDTLGGGTETIEISLTKDGPSKNVFVHEDPNVDIAVIPSLPDQKTVNFKALPADLVTSREDLPKLGVWEWAEVFFAGLFIPHIGANRNFTVVRFGRLALISDEKISWNGTPTDLYLIESASYGGNS